MLRLFLDRERFPVRVELYHAVLPGILYIIAKDGRSLLPLRCPFQHLGKTLAIENIVAQNQSHPVVPDKFLSDQEGVRQPSRIFLHRVAHLHAKLGAVAEQLLKHRQIPGRGDNQHLPDACQHQRRQRIINHGLVIYRHNLL